MERKFINLKDMEKYTFPEQFGTLEIEPNSIEVLRVNDNIIDEIADVEVILTYGTSKYNVVLYGFKYSETWTNQEALDWALIKLQDYLTN